MYAYAACLIVSGVMRAHAETAAPFLVRDPSVSLTQVAFSYAGDIWIANRDGTALRRLTSAGHEAKPVFSPDGSQVAFVGEYDGLRALYVVPVAGGTPHRLTYHPADLGQGSIPDVVAWTSDGKHLLFNSGRGAFAWPAVQYMTSQLFTVPATGGAVTQVPLATAVQAAFSADGTHIAYVPNVRRQVGWKRYRGGETTPIWIANLADSSIVAKIPRDNSNDFNPMWIGQTIYFLSDRDGPVTLFAYDLNTQTVRQVIRNDGLDIKSAAAAPDAIVYEQFGSLHLLSLSSLVDRTLDIHPKADFPEVKPHFKKVEPSQLSFADLAPAGDRAVFGARGEILTVQPGQGHIYNLTHTTDVAERDPAWSPDGQSIAYFSDESGEYALHVRAPDGHGEVRKINLGSPPAFYYTPTWSPDSRKIAYTDQRLNYWYVDLNKKTPVRMDTDLFTDPSHGPQLTWSPDSRWIAYTRQLSNHFHAVFIYSLAEHASYQLTDGASDVLGVAFDKNGQYLYFTASTDVALTSGWMDETSLQRPVTRYVYATILAKTSPSPLALTNDDRRVQGARERANDAREAASAVDIDLQGIEQRIVALPIPARNYYGLFAGKPGELFLVAGPSVDPLQSYSGGLGGAPTAVQRFDLRTQKTQQILDEVTAFHPFLKWETSFHLSASGEAMLYARRGQWFLSRVERSADGTSRPLNLDDMEVYVDPRAEWHHMYEQVWRGERDFFYDPNLHGLNLEGIKKKYEPYLQNIATREDLNYLFTEMLSNLSVSHLNTMGGDTSVVRRPSIGLLGADYDVDRGRYRFTRIYGGDTWDPDVRAPLTRPGAEVRVGEYLLAVNGREVRPTADVYSFFEQTADQRVTLTVATDPEGSDAREVTTTALSDETALRNFAWIERNRRKVDEMTGGRVAYVYLPDTSARGYRSFNREFFAQVGKSAAIIDERYNAGGVGSDYVIDYLRRPLMNYWHMRYGHDITAPQEAIFGPKVMIINEMAGSGGDALPWAFRQAQLGPLIGKRTWGGLVGGYAIPDDLLDGCKVWTPDLAFYNPNGSWDIENHGVQPDIEVDDDPKIEREGHDPQLEKAIEVALQLLERAPPPKAQRLPPYPNYQTNSIQPVAQAKPPR